MGEFLKIFAIDLPNPNPKTQNSKPENSKSSSLNTPLSPQTKMTLYYKRHCDSSNANIGQLDMTSSTSIPYAFQQAGFGLGILLLALVAWVTDYSLRLMVQSAHVSGTFSYSGIMAAAFGSTGFYLLSTLQFMYPFIAMVSYNVVVGDTVTKVLVRMFGLSPTALLARRDFVVLLCAFTVVIPLCYSHGTGADVWTVSNGSPGSQRPSCCSLHSLKSSLSVTAMVSYNVVVGDTVTKVLVGCLDCLQRLSWLAETLSCCSVHSL
ncbi:hypothetical protein J6590_065353 [Homalodisca vitripennis]|nr:hypothetical protein J6590_065353 [Homalodisca vitripennis]